MLDNDRFNKWFNAFILSGMTLVMIVMTLLELRDAESGRGLLIVAAFGSLMGVMSTVCSANARILTFLFGLFDVCIYGAMCFMSEKYGNADYEREHEHQQAEFRPCFLFSFVHNGKILCISSSKS